MQPQGQRRGQQPRMQPTVIPTNWPRAQSHRKLGALRKQLRVQPTFRQRTVTSISSCSSLSLGSCPSRTAAEPHGKGRRGGPENHRIATDSSKLRGALRLAEERLLPHDSPFASSLTSGSVRAPRSRATWPWPRATGPTKCRPRR